MCLKLKERSLSEKWSKKVINVVFGHEEDFSRKKKQWKRKINILHYNSLWSKNNRVEALWKKKNLFGHRFLCFLIAFTEEKRELKKFYNIVKKTTTKVNRVKFWIQTEYFQELDIR